MLRLLFITYSLFIFFALSAKELERKLTLPKHIKKGLNEDMHVIQSHMNQILDSMSRGQWKTMHENAIELKDNFIMKQKLSKKDLQLLQKTMPKGYIESDKQFHYWASVVAVGAKKKNAQIVSRGYTGLVNTCMTCHAQYAPYMFTDFKDYIPPKKEDPKAIYKHPEDWR